MDDILRRLGQRIRELRIERGYKSQDDASQGLGLHRAFMGHLETGRKDFRLTTLIRVANVFGVTLSELFDGVDKGERTSKQRRRKAKAKPADLDRRRLLRDVAALERITKELRDLAQTSAPSKERPGNGKP